MVKSYLRFVPDGGFGVVASSDCNVLSVQGKFALTARGDAILFWKVRTSTVVRQLIPENIGAGNHSNAGPNVVIIANRPGKLWNHQDGNCLLTLSGHKSAVSALTFSEDGNFLASGSHDTDIVLWDTVAEAGICRFRGHREPVTAIQFLYGPKNKNGVREPKYLVSASKDHLIKVWDIATQMCIQTIADHRAEVWSVVVNPSQTRIVAGSTNHMLRVYKIDPEAKPIKQGEDVDIFLEAYGHLQRPMGKDNVLGLTYASLKDGAETRSVLVVQGSQSKRVEFFRVHPADEIKKRIKRRIKRAKEKAKKKAEKAGESKKEEETIEEANERKDEPQLTDEFSTMPSWAGKAKLRSCSYDSKTESLLVSAHNNSMELIKLNADLAKPKSILDQEAEDEELDVGAEFASTKFRVDLPGHRAAVRSVCVSHDDSLILTTAAEGCKVWNANTKRCVRTVSTGYGLCGFFVAGNQHVVIGTQEGDIELVDLSTSTVVHREHAHEGAVFGITQNVKKNGFATCGSDKMVREWSLVINKMKVSDGTERTEVSFKPVIRDGEESKLEMNDDCLCIEYSPDGKYLAVGLQDFTCQLHYADSFKHFLALYGHKLPITCLAFSDDGQILATGSADKNIKLWSTQFGSCFRSLRAHDDSVMQLKFMAGTHYLASVSRDRSLRLWDCDAYELISTLVGHSDAVWALSMSQDASFIATGGNDRGIRIWKRTDEQLFLEEEREKELEAEMEEGATRDDVQGHLKSNEVVAARPSRRTLETVRTTERLIEVLDEAGEEKAKLKKYEEDCVTATKNDEKLPAKPTPSPLLFGASPHMHVMRFVHALTANTVYEVLLALPFNYAIMLLEVLVKHFESSKECMKMKLNTSADNDDEGLGVLSYDMPVRCVLILIQVHFQQLGNSSVLRPMLTSLQSHMRALLSMDQKRIGYVMAGLNLFQQDMKKNKVVLADVSDEPAAKRQKFIEVCHWRVSVCLVLVLGQTNITGF
eukprot:gene291-163_t